MSDEYPDWPGPRDAEEGVAYTRDDINSDRKVFVVDTIDNRDGGIVVIKGRYMTHDARD